MITTLLRPRRGPGFWLLAILFFCRAAGVQAQVWERAQAVGTSPYQGTASATKTVTDAAGNTYVAGSFSGTVAFGSTILTGGYNDVFVAKLNASGTYQWVVRGGGGSEESKLARSLAVDAAGNVYVAGTFGANLATFGTTVLSSAVQYTLTGYVAKLNGSGQWQWAIQTQGGRYAELTALAADATGTVYVAGNCTGTASLGAQTLPANSSFVAQVSSTGQCQWVSAIGAGAKSMVADAAGNVYLTGSYRGTSLSFGSLTLTGGQAYSSNTYVAKLSASGQWQWVSGSSSTGSGCSAEVAAVALDATGNVYVAGQLNNGYNPTFGTITLAGIGYGSGSALFVAQLNAAGQWQWAQQNLGGVGAYIIAEALAVDVAGAVYVSGQAQGPGITFGSTTLTTSLSDAFVAKLGTNRQWAWATQATGPGSDYAYGLALGTNGNLSVVGAYRQASLTLGATVLESGGQTDAFIAQLNATGQWQWAKGSATGGLRKVTALMTDAAGNTYLAGFFSGTQTFGSTTLSAAGSDAFVGKLNSAGQWQWVVRGGGSAADQINALALDAAGNVYVVGEFASRDALFGTTPLSSNGGTSYGMDLFVAKLNGSGQWLWAQAAGGTGDDYCHGLAVDAAGNLSITGEYGSPQLAFGSTTLPNAGSNYATELYVAKLNTGGQWLWATKGSSSGRDESYGIALDASGNTYVTGFSQSPSLTLGSTTLTGAGYMAFVAKLDATGNWLWGSGQADASGSRVQLDAAGNVYVGGGYWGMPTIGGVTLPRGDSSNVFVAKLNPSGQWLWGLGAGATGRENLTDFALDAAGNAYLTGFYASNRAVFGSTTLYHTGGTYAFVAKATPAGQWSWAQPVPSSGTTALALSGQQLYVAGDFYTSAATFGSSVVSNTQGDFSGTFLAVLADRPLAAHAAAATALLGGEAYPSPSAGPLTVAVQPRQPGPVLLTVRDALGRVRTTRTLGGAAGVRQQLTLDEAATWPAGVYRLIIRQGGQQQVLPVVRQ
ncbi:hypothetical protein [Hymenobacter edaphi]|uniref:Secretion system C-terminal sorting domain-containing protein n=1 Tax=Hymenobacter edaphi TaxID=2211146 RepID=A0A328B9K0_9BACT|nr:hypothetical protein [Hymenobacter edaphi]RAK64100.1 hypothetical protein DLM85_19365 [Hymenobacter edaphi]